MTLVIHPKTDKILPNTLSVGTNGEGMVVINHPKLQTDPQGQGYIWLSPEQARNLATVLLNQADAAESQ